MMSRSLFILSALLLLSSVQPAKAADRYFLMVFGSQAKPNIVWHAHTFGTFVHARGEGADPAQWTVQQVVTISWMPRTLKLRPFALRPEEGVNLDLEGSFASARDNHACVSMWGPYEICGELFCMAVARAEWLESGMARYKVADRFRRPYVLDCVHSLSGVYTEPGKFLTRLAHGDIAAYFDLHHFERFIIDPSVTHDWVAEQIGVFCHPVRRRAFCEVPPSILPFFYPTYRRWVRNP